MKYIYLLLLIFCAVNTSANEHKRAFIYYYDQPNGLYDYFIKTTDGKWEEISVINDTVKYKFHTVSEDRSQTILYDDYRKIFIRLTETKCYWGEHKEDITKFLYDGYWITLDEGPTMHSFTEKGDDIFMYEKQQCRGCFVKHGKEWLEYCYHNELLINTYTIVEQAEDQIILQNKRGGYYVMLRRNFCSYSASKNGEYNRMYCGHWTGKGLDNIKSSADKGLSRGRSFYYFLKDNSSSYYGYYTSVSGDNWVEIRIADEKVLFHYRLILETSDMVILYDESRAVYVRLTENGSYRGSSKSDINNKIYSGAWYEYEYGYSLTVLLEIDIDINVFSFSEGALSGYYRRSDDGYWIEYNDAGGSAINTFIIIEEAPTFIILRCDNCGYFMKITEDGLYYGTDREGPYTKKADGKWSKGKVQNGPETKNKQDRSAAAKSQSNASSSAVKPSQTGNKNEDPLTSLKAFVTDSVSRLMKLPSLTNKAIDNKKIDKKNLENVAADIARLHLATLKKNAIKKFNGKTVKLSGYDKRTQMYTLVWNTDIFTIQVPVAESDAFKTNWNKMVFSDPDFFFDGARFRLIALKITNPATKKTYSYDTRNQKRTAPVLKLGDLNVTLPG